MTTFPSLGRWLTNTHWHGHIVTIYCYILKKQIKNAKAGEGKAIKHNYGTTGEIRLDIWWCLGIILLLWHKYDIVLILFNVLC